LPEGILYTQKYQFWYFWKALEETTMLVYLLPIGIFTYGHLIYLWPFGTFMAIWYIYGVITTQVSTFVFFVITKTPVWSRKLSPM
jgi:hypothetical protein